MMDIISHVSEEDLAINGGKPVALPTQPTWPFYEDDEIRAVKEVLVSGKVNYWTGDQGREFEREFSSYVGCDYGVAVANGTLALELALHAIGIRDGDEVIVPSRSFMATASCVVMRGATPVFADIDSVSQCISAKSIEEVITNKTRAVIVVHFAGWPCDMDKIMSIASDNNLKVVEDCAQAHGAKYHGRNVGSIGDVSAFSFCQDKIMSTGGEGGMLVTNNEEIWRRAWEYKDHGKSYDAVFNRQHPPGFRWVHETFGSNWRMTEMQAAIGRLQLKKLDGWVAQRQHNARFIYEGLEDINCIKMHWPPDAIQNAFYKFYIQIKPDMLSSSWDRFKIIDAINAEGVNCSVGSCSEIYREKAFSEFPGVMDISYPAARKLGETSMMFQVHPTLKRKALENIVISIKKVLSVACKKDYS